jgi:hypothetical protein
VRTAVLTKGSAAVLAYLQSRIPEGDGLRHAAALERLFADVGARASAAVAAAADLDGGSTLAAASGPLPPGQVAAPPLVAPLALGGSIAGSAGGGGGGSNPSSPVSSRHSVFTTKSAGEEMFPFVPGPGSLTPLVAVEPLPPAPLLAGQIQAGWGVAAPLPPSAPAGMYAASGGPQPASARAYVAPPPIAGAAAATGHGYGAAAHAYQPQTATYAATGATPFPPLSTQGQGGSSMPPTLYGPGPTAAAAATAAADLRAMEHRAILARIESLNEDVQRGGMSSSTLAAAKRQLVMLRSTESKLRADMK